MADPSLVTIRPASFHLLSLTPRMSRLCLFISSMTCAVLEGSYMVRTFHAPIRTVVLGPSKLLVGRLTSLAGLSSGAVITPVVRPEFPVGSCVVFLFVVVSVTRCLFMWWGC